MLFVPESATRRNVVVPVPVTQARAVFIDKDGTLLRNDPDDIDPSAMRFTEGAFEGLRLLAAHGFELIVVTNQPSPALNMFDRVALVALQRGLTQKLADEGIRLDGFYACPHAPSSGPVMNCLCRKPAPGLMHQAARSRKLDLQRSWMIGDILDDVEAGRRAGCRSVLLDVGNETAWRMTPLRTPHHRAPDLLSAARIVAQQSE